MVMLPLTGTQVSNSTAALSGTGADGGPITSLSSQGTRSGRLSRPAW
jgi:hypothetical protein